MNGAWTRLLLGLGISVITGILTYAVTMTSLQGENVRRLDLLEQAGKNHRERSQEEHTRQWITILENRQVISEMRRELDQRR